MPRKQISLQLSDMTQEKIAALAKYWGFPPVRHNTPVIAEAIDRVYRNEKEKLENMGFVESEKPTRE